VPPTDRPLVRASPGGLLNFRRGISLEGLLCVETRATQSKSRLAISVEEHATFLTRCHVGGERVIVYVCELPGRHSLQ
jgi:hypothetical protein